MAIKGKKTGFSIVEITVSVSILALSFVGLVGFIASSYSSIVQAKQEEKTLLSAREAMDAVRNFRDNTSWATNGIGTLATGAIFHPTLQTVGATTTWAMAAGAETSPVRRQIVFSPVSRDTISKNIDTTYNAARNDTQTRLVTVTAGYGKAHVELTAYFTNWK